jgi:biotin synthase
MVATTRIIMPETQVRLSAGRMNMSREGQAMCFFCWCKFYFAGDKLLTTPNPDVNEDMKMFEMLGLNPQNLSQKSLNHKPLKLKTLNLPIR